MIEMRVTTCSASIAAHAAQRQLTIAAQKEARYGEPLPPRYRRARPLVSARVRRPDGSSKGPANGAVMGEDQNGNPVVVSVPGCTQKSTMRRNMTNLEDIIADDGQPQSAIPTRCR